MVKNILKIVSEHGYPSVQISANVDSAKEVIIIKIN